MIPRHLFTSLAVAGGLLPLTLALGCGDTTGDGSKVREDGGASSLDGGKGSESDSDGGSNPFGHGGDYYNPDASVDFANVDPSIDPGPDPIFTADSELAKNETYSYVFTKPGDHTFPANTCVFQFDAGGTSSLLSVLSPMKTQLASCTGIAIYLTANASMLKDADLATLQVLNLGEDKGGLAATKLARLYVYNLKKMQGGVECLPESGLSCAGKKDLGNHTYLWANGWAGGWVTDLVMDDLEAVPDGAFCGAKFYTLSMRGLKTVGKMGFGEQPHGHLRYLYLPSVTTIGEHAFRRIQVSPTVWTKVVLPRVTRIDSYAFDDNTDLGYVNAPELKTIGRNVFNDTGKLISVNMPKLESLEHGTFGINSSTTILRLPSLVTIIGDGLSNMQKVKLVHLPSLTTLGGGALGGDPQLQALFVPKLALMDANALQGTSALKKLNLPSPDVTLKSGALSNASVEELTIGGLKKTFQISPFQSCPTLKAIHFGDTPPIQTTNAAFAGSNAALVGYYTGSDPAWSTFTFGGNATAKLVRE